MRGAQIQLATNDRPCQLNNFFKPGAQHSASFPCARYTMLARSPLVHYSLVTIAVAVLGGLIYLQFSDYLPENMQLSGAVTLRQQNPDCALAEVPGEHLFVAASVWEGGVPTDIVIGSPPLVAKAVRVDIAQGDRPLTVFLSGYGVIFDFAGDIARVARVVAMSPMLDRKVAVAGVPADRVDFPAQRNCKFFAGAMAPDDGMARAKALAVMFGRRPQHAAYQGKAVRISLPDAAFGLPPEELPANTPSRPRMLDPGQMISALSVTRPAILPGEAGLMQLEAAGAIRRPRAEEVEEFISGASLPYQSKLSPDYRLAAKFDYVITRAVTLPPSQGMQNWGFLVAAGVPAPRNPGRACIAQMDGFRVNNVASCFADAREGIERLRDLPAAEKVAGCRLLEAPEEASLEAVTAYEPEKANRGFRQKPTPHPIEVRVERRETCCSS